MRITELFTAKSIELDSAASNRDEILSRLVELQATHGNITDTEAYKKALYAREDEASTYVDNGITVPHAKTNVVTRPSLAALRLSTPVQYNAEDDGKTDLLFAIAAPENGSLHVDMLARMMQMLMNEDFVEKLKAAKTPTEFLALIDAQEEAQFGEESFTQQAIPQSGYRILAVTACPNGIAHTYMAAEALAKAGDKLGLPTKVETNGSDGAKNVLTRAEIAACDGIIVAADKNVETARFDGKPVLFARVDDGIHKPEELLKKVAHGEVPVYHAKGGAAAAEEETSGDSFGRKVYKDLMNGVSHMLPFVVGGGIMIALAFLLEDASIKESISPYYMARIVDFPAFVADYPFKADGTEREWRFSMTDPIMECNQGSFLLKISKDGRGTAVKISEPCADSISIQTMTTMLMGYKRPDYLAKIGRIHAGGETIDMLEDAIEQQPPYISDYF